MQRGLLVEFSCNSSIRYLIAYWELCLLWDHLSLSDEWLLQHYQVKSGGITRELDKEPSLHCSSIYITYKWSVLQQCVYLSSCPLTHPYVFSIRPPCFLHVPWRHTFNLRCTCVHHVYTIRNCCPLMSSLTLTPTLDSSWSFQTALDSVTWLPCHVPISYPFVCCRLIITTVLTLTLPKVCPHSRLITV